MTVLRIILCFANVALVFLYVKGIIHTELHDAEKILVAAGVGVLRFPAPVFATLALCTKKTRKWTREGAIGFNALLFVVFNAGWLISTHGRPFSFRPDMMLCAINLMFFWAQSKFDREHAHSEPQSPPPVAVETSRYGINVLSVISMMAPVVGILVSLSLMMDSGPADIGLGFVVLGIIIVSPVLGLALSLLVVTFSKRGSLLAKTALWLNLSYLFVILTMYLRWKLF